MLVRQFTHVRNGFRIFTSFCTIKDSTQSLEWPTTVLEQLVSEYGNKQRIYKLFKSNPYFENSEIYFWRNFINTLHNRGFQIQDCFNILDGYPPALALKPKSLEDALQEWQLHSHLGLDMLKFLIVNRPEFLALSPKIIRARVPFLLSYSTSKDWLLTLLFLCPNLLQDDWKEILKKIKFLGHEMVVYRTEILQCKALSKPLKHIQLRFSVLDKCGLYKRPNPYEHKQTKKERLKLKNPPLKSITDKTDSSFATKIAKITVEEYEVYADLFYSSENESKESDSSESDEE